MVAPASDFSSRVLRQANTWDAGNGPEIFRSIDADKLHEAAQVIFVGAPRLQIIDIGEPFDRRRHIAQLVILRGGQNRDFRCNRQFRKDPCFEVLE